MEDLRFMRLWDLYQPLLTDRQREITNLYFNCDLSLAEIAEQNGCSRQSVSDCLIKCRKQLEEYEEKLHFSRMLTEVSLTSSFLATDLQKLAEELGGVAQEKIQEILSRDYSAEADEAIAANADELL